MRIHTCTYMHTYIYIHTYIHIMLQCVHLFKHHIYVIHTYIQTYIHTYIHTYMQFVSQYDSLSGFSCPPSHIMTSARAKRKFPQLSLADGSIKYCCVFYEVHLFTPHVPVCTVCIVCISLHMYMYVCMYVCM